MSSKQETVDAIMNVIRQAGEMRAAKMFGEYGIYCDGKMIALVSDDQFFVKPTVSGRAYWGAVEEAPPYPGAKDWFLIPEDDWDEVERLTELIRITTLEVPKRKK